MKPSAAPTTDVALPTGPWRTIARLQSSAPFSGVATVGYPAAEGRR